MSTRDQWPEDLVAFLTTRFGEIVNATRQTGVAGHGCTRVQLARGSVIVKASTEGRERAFYETHAGDLRPSGVNVPDLYWSGADESGIHWLVLEDIPHPFPKERWMADPGQLDILFRLHHATWRGRRPTLDDPYTPMWDDEVTELAMDWFARSAEADEIRSRLMELQDAFADFPTTDCCISGDPNPTNWRIRDDGTLVLLDWERFGYGTPAFDLAITIPGIGTEDGSAESVIAANYIKLWEDVGEPLPYDRPTMVQMIRFAKLFTAIELLANASRSRASYPPKTVQFVTDHLPDLLRRLS
jgi:hypothetical protein